jgi:hypothetical protein
MLGVKQTSKIKAATSACDPWPTTMLSEEWNQISAGSRSAQIANEPKPSLADVRVRRAAIAPELKRLQLLRREDDRG